MVAVEIFRAATFHDEHQMAVEIGTGEQTVAEPFAIESWKTERVEQSSLIDIEARRIVVGVEIADAGRCLNPP